MDLTGQLDQAWHRKMAEARRAIGQSTTTTTATAGVDALDSATAKKEGQNLEASEDSKTSQPGDTGDDDAAVSRVGLKRALLADRSRRHSKEEDEDDDRRETGEGKDKKDSENQQAVVGSVQSRADSGAHSSTSYSDGGVASGLGQSLNTADSGCWPKET